MASRKGPERFLWLVIPPAEEGEPRLYISKQVLERDLPQSARNKPRQIDKVGDKWEYGRNKKFKAQKLVIRDFEDRPRS